MFLWKQKEEHRCSFTQQSPSQSLCLWEYFLGRRLVARPMLQWLLTVATLQVLHACKLNIFGYITNLVLTSKWKQTFKTAALFRCPILSIVILLESQFFSLRSPSLLLKGLHWVRLLILPVCLHKHTKSSLDHLWSLSPRCWNSQRKFLDWLFSSPLGAQKQSHTFFIWLHLYQFHSSPWVFHCACRFLFSHLSGKQPSFLP